MRIFSVVFFLWAGAAFGQSYPDYTSTTVNDFANLLSADDERQLSARLSKLKSDTGVEMTVLTLASQSSYALDKTIEQFATGLFNYWGIGDASRNDGVLVLVLRDDRAMRVELGTAYGRDWDRAAENVIDDHFLPAFRADDYARGILQGSTAVIKEIVVPFRGGEGAPKGSKGPDPVFLLFGLLFVASGLHSNRRGISDAAARFRKCPNCGRRGLRADRDVTRPSTQTMAGRGTRRIYCIYCDHNEASDYTIARLSFNNSSGGRFGGGSSGGDGGSGRW